MTDMPVPPHLLERARSLAAPGSRRILGIAGAPGAGKSTLAARLVDALDGLAVLVPMDGYHLAQQELLRLGRAHRKGAPDTFDAAGYAALLARLRDHDTRAATVYAPAFDRAIEEPVAGSIPVDPGVPLVVTEGNYLLHDEGPWAHIRPLLDEVWFLELDPEVRAARLVDRHMRFGKERPHAESWVRDCDEPNARLIGRGRDRADLVVPMGEVGPLTRGGAGLLDRDDAEPPTWGGAGLLSRDDAGDTPFI
ncbi:nucleoside/nucleotide kinase family protein [Streptomyces sp. NPDC096176]|uniref:nucleoside/nucleotide kinase family protein n=1 Tax=Streptomyces sp. NPDC096176 TaxID=3366079 RepID=UPI0038262CB9